MRRPIPELALVQDNPDFRKLWFAQLISLGGDWFNAVALVGLVLELTGSGFYAAVVLAAERIPHFFLSPLSGVIADRFDRKRLIAGAALVQAVLALGMLLVRSPATLWIGIACAAGLASLSAFSFPATQAAMPNLVTREQLGPANVLVGSSFGTMLAIGSALGGLVAASFGRDVAFTVNSISFLVAAALILSIKSRFSQEPAGERRVRPIKDVREGLDFARSNGRVMALLATKGGFGLGAGVIVLLSVFATEVFGAGDAGIGVLFAARGLGALLGPFVARAVVRDDERRLFLTIGVSMAVFGVAYAAFPFLPGLWAAAPFATLAHMGAGSQWLMSSYGLQRLTPDHVRGRIFSFDFALVTLTISISYLISGRAAELVGPRVVMGTLAGIGLAYALIWTAATRRFWTRPTERPRPPEGQPLPIQDLPLITD